MGLRPFESKGWFSPVVTEVWCLVVSKSDGWCLLVFKSEGSSPGRLIEGARRGRAGGEGLASILGQSILWPCFKKLLQELKYLVGSQFVLNCPVTCFDCVDSWPLWSPGRGFDPQVT